MHLIQTIEAQAHILLLRTFESGSEPENQQVFKAEKGEIWWPSENEIWLGLGKSPKIPSILKIFRSLFFKRKDRWPEQIVLGCKRQICQLD